MYLLFSRPKPIIGITDRLDEKTLTMLHKMINLINKVLVLPHFFSGRLQHTISRLKMLVNCSRTFDILPPLSNLIRDQLIKDNSIKNPLKVDSTAASDTNEKLSTTVINYMSTSRIFKCSSLVLTAMH